jgi:transposase-like protein
MEKMEVQKPEVKARVIAVLQALSGEKTISEICQETGLKQIQYYKLEGQLLKGMVMAAEASLAGGRRRNPLLESQDLEERNRRLRQEVLRSQAMLRLTRKLFKTAPRGPKNGPRRGRPPKAMAPAKPEPTPGSVPSK